MTLKDISTTVYPNLIFCSYLCDDGSFIKQKYIGYSLSEAKRAFKAQFGENT